MPICNLNEELIRFKETDERQTMGVAHSNTWGVPDTCRALKNMFAGQEYE